MPRLWTFEFTVHGSFIDKNGNMARPRHAAFGFEWSLARHVAWPSKRRGGA
jgi:hypothetical protein